MHLSINLWKCNNYIEPILITWILLSKLIKENKYFLNAISMYYKTNVSIVKVCTLTLVL